MYLRINKVGTNKHYLIKKQRSNVGTSIWSDGQVIFLSIRQKKYTFRYF